MQTSSYNTMAARLMQSWAMFGITVILSVFVALYIHMTRNFNYWKRRGVAEEKPIPFFGSFFPCVTLRKSANDFFKETYNKHAGERIVGFYLFDKPAVLVRDIDLNNRIMVKDFSFFANRYARSGDHDSLGSSNLMMLGSPHWKTLRGKLSPIFSSGKLRSMFQLMLHVSEDLDHHLESSNLEGEGRTIELKEICGKYTTDVIATCAYGLKTNSLNNPNSEFRNYGRKIFTFDWKRGLEFGAIFFAPGIVKPLGLMFFEKTSGNFLRKALWDTLTQRLENRIHRNDLIDTLIELKNGQTQAEIDDPNSFKFDGDNLTAQAAIFFTGGFGTTTLTLSYTLYELALNQEIQSRLREEIISAFEENNEALDYYWIMHLPYLDMVISETLRKYPVLGFIDRVAAEDYEVPDSDIVIPKGTPVYVPIAGFHHDPQYFPDPEKYDPERFSVEGKRNRPSRAYIPFGEGPRNCIGLRFALVSMKLGLIKMLLNYKFSPCAETVIPPRPNPRAFFTEMDHDLLLNVQKITTDGTEAW